VHHLFVLRAFGNQRKNILEHLAGKGINSLIHYPFLSHHQYAIAEHRLAPAGLPAAISHSEVCFSMPIHPFLSDAEVDHIVNNCNASGSN